MLPRRWGAATFVRPLHGACPRREAGASGKRPLRRFQPSNPANPLGEKVDQQPGPGDACALWNDQHAQRHWRQGKVRQDCFEPSSRQEIVGEPLMRGCDAPSGDKCFASGQETLARVGAKPNRRRGAVERGVQGLRSVDRQFDKNLPVESLSRRSRDRRQKYPIASFVKKNILVDSCVEGPHPDCAVRTGSSFGLPR